MLGSIIKQERLNQDMKQDVLCYGICSVSYLSKIENDQADASDEVLFLLFKKLGIHYQIDVDEEGIKELFANIEKYALFDGFKLETSKVYLKELKEYKFSRYYWDVYLREILLNIGENQKELDEALPHDLLYHPYTAIYYANSHIRAHEVQEAIRRLLLARGQDKTGAVDFSLSQSYFYAGDFQQSIEYAKLSLDAFALNGNVRMMTSSHFQLGNAYVYSDFDQALHHFESCRRIADVIDDQYIHSVLDYNLGADYLDRFFRSEDIDYLNSANTYIMRAYKHSEFKGMDMYEKVILVHLYQGNKQGALRVYQAFESFIESNPELKNMPEYDALVYAMSHDSFYLDKEYAKIVKQIFDNNRESRIYSRSIFIQNMLAFVYRKQKRYKAVLDLINFPIQ